MTNRAGHLTGTETAMVLLAARGLTNKQIADELQTTIPRVALNLHRVYRKLGVRSRAEMLIKLHTAKN